MSVNIHKPVMLTRCVELMTKNAQEPSLLVDATLGLGGHSEAMLQAAPQAVVVGIDRDPQALKMAATRLAKYGDRFIAVHAVYNEICAVIKNVQTKNNLSCKGVLFDLGVSSMQLDKPERGFAYAQEAPLDMRMDQSTGVTAAALIADLDADQLAEIFKKYGDEPLAKRYAQAIVTARKDKAINSSLQLVEILQQATPIKLKKQRHPAKRVFQALRVVVNNELKVLAEAIPAAMENLNIGGRLVVMSYQSHEDKIVKNYLTEAAKDNTPQGLPTPLPEYAPQFKLLTRGAEKASLKEQQENPRAIPARLRAAERVRTA